MNTDWKDILSKMGGDLADTETGAVSAVNDESCPDDKKPVAKSVTVFYETKGRAGKQATILGNFQGVDEREIENLASELKRSLGTGGSCRGGEILIQGDRREKARAFFVKKGFKVKG